MSGNRARAQRKAAAASQAETVDGTHYLASVLERFCRATERLLVTSTPAEGAASQVDAHSRDLTPLDGFSRPGLEASLLPLRQLNQAVDHLRGAAATLRAPSVIYSTYTLYRSAAESAANAYYLADLQVDTRVRVARWLSLRLKGYEEKTRAVDDEQRPQMVADYKMCVAQAKDAGFDLVKAPRRHEYVTPFVVDGKPYPSALKLVGELYADLDPDMGKTLYRFTSAIAHGQDHGTAAMRIGQPEQTEDDRVVSVAAGVTFDDMLTFALTAFAGLRIATERVADYCGWETKTWSGEKDAAQRALFALVGAQERDIT